MAESEKITSAVAPLSGVEIGKGVTESSTFRPIVTLCPGGCGCAPGEADMRDCAFDGACVFDEAWR